MEENVVRDWMTPNPITITPDARLVDAYRLLKRHHVCRLPVVENEELVGIVTLSDIRKFLPLEKIGTYHFTGALRNTEVTRVMSPNVVTIGVEATVPEAAKLMLEYDVGGIPVVGKTGGRLRLIGIISESDLFRMILEKIPSDSV